MADEFKSMADRCRYVAALVDDTMDRELREYFVVEPRRNGVVARLRRPEKAAEKPCRLKSTGAQES
jgi:hypothetical protein